MVFLWDASSHLHFGQSWQWIRREFVGTDKLFMHINGVSETRASGTGGSNLKDWRISMLSNHLTIITYYKNTILYIYSTIWRLQFLRRFAWAASNFITWAWELVHWEIQGCFFFFFKKWFWCTLFMTKFICENKFLINKKKKQSSWMK